jgi:hypothetical protein
MLLQKTIRLACPFMCTLCLAAGYAMYGWGLVALTGASIGLAWWLASYRPATPLPLAALVISMAWSAAGLLAGAPAPLMILSATLALASWDLVLFDHSLSANPISSAATRALFQNRHYRSLAWALGLGLLIVFVGRTIQVQVPLIIIVLLVLLALFSIDRLWRALKE